MNSSAHISVETLVDLAEDRVTVTARDAAMAHVARCARCEDKLRRLQQIILLTKTDRAEDPPRDVLLAAINVFLPKTQAPVRRIVARLTFDSRTAGPAFGLRSVQAASRQMLYAADDIDLDLRITMQNEECVITGQVFGAPCAEGVVEISGATGSAEAYLNELCEFSLPPLPIGDYSLRVKLSDVEILIPELELNK